MLAVNYTNLRDNMKKYMDAVTDNYETLIVTRKNNKNVVMISEEAYNNLMENVYVMGCKSNFDWLMESRDQLEKGKVRSFELSEAADDFEEEAGTASAWKTGEQTKGASEGDAYREKDRATNRETETDTNREINRETDTEADTETDREAGQDE